jgi:hypothetical protein
VVRGRRDAGVSQFRAALAGFDRVDLKMHAAAVRYYLGLLIGGPEGRELLVEAEARMHEEHVINPARMASIYVCGVERIGARPLTEAWPEPK